MIHILGVTKRHGTNFRTHSSHLEDEIKLYEHGSGNALFPFSPTFHSIWGKCTLGYAILQGYFSACGIQYDGGRVDACINADGGHFEHLL